jgi:hypothetical protein
MVVNQLYGKIIKKKWAAQLAARGPFPAAAGRCDGGRTWWEHLTRSLGAIKRAAWAKRPGEPAETAARHFRKKV